MTPNNKIFMDSVVQDDELFVVNNLSFEEEPHLKFKLYTVEMASINSEASGELNLIWMPGDDRHLIPGFDPSIETDSPVMKATWLAAESENEMFFSAIEKIGVERYEIMSSINDYINHPPIVHDNAIEVREMNVIDTLSNESSWNDPAAGHKFRLEADVIIGGEGEHIEDRIDLRELYVLSGKENNVRKTDTYNVIYSALQDGRRNLLIKGNETLTDERIAEGLASNIINHAIESYRLDQRKAKANVRENTIGSLDALVAFTNDARNDDMLKDKIVSLGNPIQRVFNNNLRDIIGPSRFTDIKLDVGTSISTVFVDELAKATAKTVQHEKDRVKSKEQGSDKDKGMSL